MLNVEASKAAHNLICKWAIGGAKLILQLLGLITSKSIPFV